mmetsp:Transcript_15069/g.34305  ORF Transcript_15069/g.34305 Transcript_15069/m.34305 type:complete len:167 (-) Transcript_15069:65-565(-)|eukprot:4943875-Amphidinium_carterae.1
MSRESAPAMPQNQPLQCLPLLVSRTTSINKSSLIYAWTNGWFVQTAQKLKSASTNHGCGCLQALAQGLLCRSWISYTGVAGTEYTSNSNVDEWELENCGNNECIIKDVKKVKSVALGDMLFIKGRHFPRLRKGSKGLVHKSAKLTYTSHGQIINRLVLKVDAMGKR